MNPKPKDIHDSELVNLATELGLSPINPENQKNASSQNDDPYDSPSYLTKSYLELT